MFFVAERERRTERKKKHKIQGNTKVRKDKEENCRSNYSIVFILKSINFFLTVINLT